MSAKSVAGSLPPGTGQQPPKRVTPVPAAWRNKRKWVMLAVDYMDSAKLIRAGQDGELMFVRMVARCGGRLSDGYLEVAYVLRLCADLHGGPDAALESIRREGLVTVEDGMVHLIGYLDHQISSAQINGALEADAARKAASAADYKSRQAAEAGAVPAVAEGADAEDATASTETAPPPSPVAGKPGQIGFDPAADQGCEYLAHAVERVSGSRPMVTKAWRTDMRVVLDGSKPDVVRRTIDAAMAEDFWRKTMHSPRSLRENWTKLIMLTGPKAAKGGPGPSQSTSAARPHKPRQPAADAPDSAVA